MDTNEAVKVTQFAQAVGTLKQAKDRSGGVLLTAEDVEGLVWGIQLLRKGSENAARTA